MYMSDYDSSLPTNGAYNMGGDFANEAYNGHAPYSWWGGGSNLVLHYSIRAQLDPYIKNDNIWFCPSDSASNVWGTGTTNGDPTKRFTSYHYTLWFGLTTMVGNLYGMNGMYPPYTDGFFLDCARVYAFCETLPYHDMRPNPNTGLDGWHWLPDVKENLVCLDGHAKTSPLSQHRYCSTEGGTYMEQDMHWPGMEVSSGNYPGTWWNTPGCPWLEDFTPGND
jgi:hypothetical protein